MLVGKHWEEVANVLSALLGRRDVVFSSLVFTDFAVLVVLSCLLFGRKCIGGSWRYYGKDESAGVERETALDIFKKRYVKGEMSKEGFEQMKKDLSL